MTSPIIQVWRLRKSGHQRVGTSSGCRGRSRVRSSINPAVTRTGSDHAARAQGQLCRTIGMTIGPVRAAGKASPKSSPFE